MPIQVKIIISDFYHGYNKWRSLNPIRVIKRGK